MDESREPGSAATTHAPEGSPIPLGWFSYAAAMTGLSALVASAITLVTRWDEDARLPGDGGVDGIDRVAAALGTISGATIALLLVALVADRGDSRRWAILGAAAYALAYVLRAALEQRSFTLLG